jgi:guanylate kinase
MRRQVVDIAGPSGIGKNAVIDALVSRYKKCSRLVTATTRTPREGEVNGIDYYFFSEEEFLRELASENILEHRDVQTLGTHYGVYKPDLDKRLSEGAVILAQLDIVGARFLKREYDATTIFLQPENIEVLKNRIIARKKGMPENELAKRMKIAQREMSEDAKEFDYQVVNAEGKLGETVEKVVAILKKEGYTLA